LRWLLLAVGLGVAGPLQPGFGTTDPVTTVRRRWKPARFAAPGGCGAFDLGSARRFSFALASQRILGGSVRCSV
jgi:hypothetical protein